MNRSVRNANFAGGAELTDFPVATPDGAAL
jgi:hypothetical protein